MQRGTSFSPPAKRPVDQHQHFARRNKTKRDHYGIYRHAAPSVGGHVDERVGVMSLGRPARQRIGEIRQRVERLQQRIAPGERSLAGEEQPVEQDQHWVELVQQKVRLGGRAG